MLDTMDPKIVRALAKQEEPPAPKVGGSGTLITSEMAGGCSCTLGGRGRGAGLALALPLAGLAWLVRRRRRS